MGCFIPKIDSQESQPPTYAPKELAFKEKVIIMGEEGDLQLYLWWEES